MSIIPAPIVLFAYKRPHELRQTLQALQANHLASASELYVFIDGPKKETDRPRVEAVRQLVDELTGFRTIHRHYSDTNKGLASSVVAGVTQVIEKYGRVIVLEDDLITSPNFLDFMNQALEQYQHEARIFSITGYTFPFQRPASYSDDIYLIPRTGSWGWATWADRWQSADWQVSDYEAFMADRRRRKQFNLAGSDRVRMLRRWKEGAIDSWAIRWCYAQDRRQALTVYPTLSKIQNIGFSAQSTNTIYNRFRTVLDDGTRRTFLLPTVLSLHPYFLTRFQKKFSLQARLLNTINSRITSTLYKLNLK